MIMISKRPRCFLDVEVGNEHIGRIIIELFMETCPITCENFRLLCSGEKGIGKTTKKPLHYKGTLFHRIVKNFVIQGGDFVYGDGRGGESIYGGSFKDENFIIPHDEPFILSMANKGKDSNGSQFFITTQSAPHLDGKHTVFGKVISGTEVVTLIENVETDSNCRPLKDVKIVNCGEMVLQVKSKERKKKREVTSSSDSDEEKKSRKKRSHKTKKKSHKRDRKEHKRLSDREDDKCLIDPEEIPDVPTNRFLLRNTSPVTQERRNFSNRSRDSYSYSRRPHRSKSGRKIKGRGFMRYRTPSPTGSKSGSETPPHWKQEQSRLRKMPLPTKETTPDDSGAQEGFEQDEEMEIQNSLLPSRLGIVSKTWKESGFEDSRNNWKKSSFEDSRKNRKESAFEDSRKNSSRENNKSSSDRKFLERYSSYEIEEFSNSPMRSKIVVKSSRQEEDWHSDRKFERDTERKGRKELSERKSFSSEFERGANFQRHVVNDRHSTTNKEPKVPEKSAEQILREKQKIKSLKRDLFKYTNYGNDSDDEDDTPVHKTFSRDKSVEKENKAECSQDNVVIIPGICDEDFKLNKSDSHSPEFQTQKNLSEYQVQNEPVRSLDDNVKEPSVEEQDDQGEVPNRHSSSVENDAVENTASVELNAVVSENEPNSTSSFIMSSDVEPLPSRVPVQSVENYDVRAINNEDALSVIKLQKEVNEESEFIQTEEKHDIPKNKNLEQEKHIEPSTPSPEGSPPQQKNASPIKQYTRSPQGSSSSSPPTKRKRSKSPSDKVASSSRQNRGSVDRRSRSPVHKPRSSSPHRTGRSLASRRSKSRSRSRSGRRSTSPPRSRNRRRISRSPDNRVRRSRSRPRNERGSRFYQPQGMRHYSPPRRGNYYRPYAKSPSSRGRIKGAAYRSRSRSRSLSRRRRRQRRSSSSSASSSGHSSSSDSDAKRNKSRKLRKKKRSSSSSSSTGSSDSRSDSDSH
ncbi:peptidyl-prolyl cis-trans isomerase G-like [Uloborus diversus]|uniref:peptidyl-prolyl cis-trans isomerase G-like n=1 Tax=Uloborus diversus TaxID=327109 RepID=UPI0024095F77|nr:peptidyl-prolyl cis-trans isomerase G-like [Uloborus diversus]XP_054712513.1 peptidyl-prolyl cis-trans isomerase G-like [Uloborus diversus]XP_054712514.1 peptidyl-prolyl cis-trans isomerase G-like [Uloborus diversus]